MTSPVLKVENLVKKYGTFRAVDAISFSIPKGKIVGLLGPNGAGKTTTIQMLLGITLANGGTIRYFGKDFFTNRQACLQRINFVSAFNELLGRITVWENLAVYSRMYQVPNFQKKIADLSSYFEIEELLPLRYQLISSGQKTRVNLVKALLNDPELLLMDEPTASLDPDIADKTLSFIEKLRRERHLSILYTSHDMEEITRICDDVIFLDHGKIVAHDTPLNLTKRINSAQVRLMFDGEKKEMKKYLSKHKQSYKFPDKHIVLIDTTEKEIPKIIFGITKTGIWITDIEIEKPNLEDVFLQIARKKLYVD